MATRRPPDNPRTPDSPKVTKEIPNVIKADKPVGTVAAGAGAPGAGAPADKSAGPRVRKPAAPSQVRVEVSEDVRRSMIAEGAYLRAERRGFATGHEEEDWLAAEAEVDRLLKARHGGTSQ
ncbi:MAG: DUF2934 domain-containing protein [Sinobacteraceae bacterium]|nr:DUF2934 domain-containing protein [Nevskiaceae bacterium]